MRPWRIGLLVDTTSEVEVRNAMSMLASVWGGIYSPILDKGLQDEEIRINAECFDVDSVYVLEDSPETRKRLSNLHLLWTGYESGGPFPPETIHDGLMECSWLGGYSAPESMTSTVECANPILSQAVYGIVHDWPSRRQETFDHEFHRAIVDIPAEVSTRLLPSSGAILANTARFVFPVNALPMNGFIVVRRNCPQDVVAFWNLRAAGATVFPLDAEADVWRTDLVAAMSSLSRLPTEEGQSPSAVSVFFHAHASPDLLDSLLKSAVNADIDLHMAEKYYLVELRERFTVSTSFEGTFSAEVYRGDRSIDIGLPAVPLNGGLAGYSHYPGVIAADILFSAAENLDPRLAARLPGVRQQRDVLRNLVHSRQVRTKQYGVVCGVSGTSQSLQYKLFAKIEAISLLWGENFEVHQSGEGQFQTRAAEMLGGVTSSMITEPGIASALLKVGASPSGLTYSAIENQILNNRGDWPGKLSPLEDRPREFARQRTHALMNTGLLIPSLELECTFCRIRTQISPDRLNTEVHCEFCGEEFRLALSLSIGRDGKWKYRLAGHLAREKVEAMIPVLATMSILSAIGSVHRPPYCEVLGLELGLPQGRQIELDIACFLYDALPIAIVGEVKSTNKIDENDVSNIEQAVKLLERRDQRALALFVTSKEKFSTEEVNALRSYCERDVRFATLSRGRVIRALPLLFTGKQLRTPWSADHPWRWGKPGDSVFGIAEESCRKNLGLVELDAAGSCHWTND